MTSTPVRPAAYIRDPDARDLAETDLDDASDMVVAAARELGWPAPAVYADIGPAAQPGSQYAALTDAIAAGRHDAVMVLHPAALGDDLGQVEAFDRHCRQHGALLCARFGRTATDTRALFDLIRLIRRFTVTHEHLKLLRRAYVTWNEGEFGAPSIDSKRPYGNSDVVGDIAEILGMPEPEPDDEGVGPDPELEWRCVRLQVETGIALQIALATGEFRTGRYVRKSDWGGIDWKRVG